MANECRRCKTKKTFSQVEPCDKVFVVNMYMMEGFEFPVPNFLIVKVIRKKTCDTDGSIVLELENGWCFNVQPDDTNSKSDLGTIFTEEGDSILYIKGISSCIMKIENERFNRIKKKIKKHIAEQQNWYKHGRYGIEYVCWADDNPEPVRDNGEEDIEPDKPCPCSNNN